MAQRALLLIGRSTVSLFRQLGPNVVSLGRHHSQLSPISSQSRPDDPNSLKLSPEQLEALELAAQGVNMFITGRAGTGKSVLIKEIIKQAREKGKEVAVTAPTGLAALVIGGKTLHSWAGVRLGDKGIDYYIDWADWKLRQWEREEQESKKRERLGLACANDIHEPQARRMARPAMLDTDLLIIDEISMVCYGMLNDIKGETEILSRLSHNCLNLLIISPSASNAAMRHSVCSAFKSLLELCLLTKRT
jgi:nucleoside-triphosphatase THEP1